MTVLLYLLGVVAFVLAILASIGLHELGHMIPAKAFGGKVTQYFIGFGPTVWSRTKGETEYGVKAIPVGGYVKIVGMLPPGKDLVTNLDVRVQAAAEQGLRDAVANAHHRGWKADAGPPSCWTRAAARCSPRRATRHTTPTSGPAA